MSATVDTAHQRPLGYTERAMCRAVSSGSGITLVALLLYKSPDIQILQNALHHIQNDYPILRSKLHVDPASRTISFVTPAVSSPRLQSFDLQSTLNILNAAEASCSEVSPFEKLVEHELNLNPLGSHGDVLQEAVYEVGGGRWMLALKTHPVASDGTSASAELLLRELVRFLGRGEGVEGKGEVKMGIESYIPREAGKKSMWSRGVNMVSYGLNSLRLNNIDFVEPRSQRRSQLLRLRLEEEETARLLQGCRERKIRVFGVIAATALMAARLLKLMPRSQCQKHAVGIGVDYRPCLHPHLTTSDIGFYSSVVNITPQVNGKEQLWNPAQRIYKSAMDAKGQKKHLSDLPDLAFLMQKVLENPGLTPSSALRSGFVWVLEDIDTITTTTNGELAEMGVEDYMACSSVHGIGPTLAITGKLRDGRLDCVCVYPAPLHSRQQMQQLVDLMKRILVDASFAFAHS